MEARWYTVPCPSAFFCGPVLICQCVYYLISFPSINLDTVYETVYLSVGEANLLGTTESLIVTIPCWRAPDCHLLSVMSDGMSLSFLRSRVIMCHSASDSDSHLHECHYLALRFSEYITHVAYVLFTLWQRSEEEWQRFCFEGHMTCWRSVCTQKVGICGRIIKDICQVIQNTSNC